jgi:hypothetical protein
LRGSSGKVLSPGYRRNNRHALNLVDTIDVVRHSLKFVFVGHEDDLLTAQFFQNLPHPVWLLAAEAVRRFVEDYQSSGNPRYPTDKLLRASR